MFVLQNNKIRFYGVWSFQSSRFFIPFPHIITLPINILRSTPYHLRRRILCTNKNIIHNLMDINTEWRRWIKISIKKSTKTCSTYIVRVNRKHTYIGEWIMIWHNFLFILIFTKFYKSHLLASTHQALRVERNQDFSLLSVLLCVNFFFRL